MDAVIGAALLVHFEALEIFGTALVLLGLLTAYAMLTSRHCSADNERLWRSSGLQMPGNLVVNRRKNCYAEIALYGLLLIDALPPAAN